MCHMTQLLCPSCGHHVGDLVDGESRERRRSTRDLTGVDMFLKSETMRRRGFRTPARELHAAYLQWAIKNRAPELTAKAFGLVMADLGYKSYRTKDERGYEGLTLFTIT